MKKDILIIQKLRTNDFISHIIINETLSNTSNKRNNNKEINVGEPRHFSIKEKKKIIILTIMIKVNSIIILL